MSLASWYTRPVFISSTFKDVQTERDALRDVVFRDIDDKLKDYHRRLEPIDLRWGVETVETAEQESKELLVLKVCLDEIERCRPFLLVVLGDRYGWTPPARRMQAAVDEKGFSTKVEGKSVTALEIEYGVLDSPEQKKRSFFYFRTITNYADMPLAVRAMYSDLHRGIAESKALDDAEKQELSDLCIARQCGKLTTQDTERLSQLIAKDPAVEQGHCLLEALKQRIENDPGLAGRVRRYDARWEPAESPMGSVGVPDKWANMVQEDIWGELKQECEEGAASIDSSWQGQERTALEEFVELRSRDFVGRETLLGELHTFAFAPAQTGAPWGLCLHGGPGSGKSALFAVLVRKLQKTQETGNFLLLTHAGGISLRAGNVDALIRRWIQELARFLKLKEVDPSKELKTLEEKKKLFAELLSRASVNTRVVCVIDALNQFERSAVARHLTWLPEMWPKNARLITTCIAGNESEVLDKRAGMSLLELPRLDEREANDIIQSICRRYHRTLNRDVARLLLDKKRPDGALSCANPLWLTIAVEQLNLLDEDDFTAADRLEGTPEQKLIAFMLKTVEEFPPTIEDLYGALYRRAHERFGRRYGIGWIPEMLQLIACSRFGLRDKDLEAIICKMEAEKAGIKEAEKFAAYAAEFGVNFALQFAAVRRYLSAHLVQRDEMGLWDFVHAQGRIAVQGWKVESSGLTEQEYHRLVAGHLEGLERGDGLRLREVMWHYVKGDMKEKAGAYYGRSDLTPAEKAAATKVLAEYVLACAGAGVNTGIAWIENILAGISDYESATWFCNKVDYCLNDALADEGTVSMRITLLEKTMKVHEKLRAIAPTSADFARNLSGNYERIGDLSLQLEKLPEAIKYFGESLAIRQMLHHWAPDCNYYALDRAVIYTKLGLLYKKLGNPSEAIQYLFMANGIAAQLALDAPETSSFLDAHSASLSSLGDLYFDLGDAPVALQYYELRLTICEKLCKRSPESEKYMRSQYVCLFAMGNVQLQIGNLSQSMHYHEKAFALANVLYNRCQGSVLYARDLSMNYNAIGGMHLKNGNTSEALQCYNKCLTIREEYSKRIPDSIEFLRDLSVIYNRLGAVHNKIGNFDEALQFFQKDLSVAIKLQNCAPDSAEFARDIFFSYYNLASFYQDNSRPADATAHLHQLKQVVEHMKQRGMFVDEAIAGVYKQVCGMGV